MRDIKFRGKMLDSDDWVWGYYILCPKMDIIFKNKIYCPDINKLIDIKHDTLGQYTGIKDKNGKEIYEGDIICWEKAKKNYEVIFVDGGYCLDTPGFATDLYRCIDSKGNHLEIIGNIYDNKELLEE